MNQNQNTGRNYAEVAAGGSNNPRWEPTKNEQTPNYPMQLEGYFKKMSELPGANGPFNVAEVQMVNPDGTLGQCVDVSGGKVLDEKLRVIPLGSFVMIQFKGKVQGKNNKYNDWATFVDENAVPLHQVMGLPAPAQPFQQSAPAPQQQAPNPFGAAPVQQQAPVFNNPVQQAAPTFSQAPVQNAPFGGQPVQQSAPIQQQAPNPFAAAPVVQQQAPVQGNGQFPGQQATNPFAQQNSDLPF